MIPRFCAIARGFLAKGAVDPAWATQQTEGLGSALLETDRETVGQTDKRTNTQTLDKI